MLTETILHVKKGQCFIRFPKNGKQGPKYVLQSGMRLAINPQADLWIEGEYIYDPFYQEHAWRSDETHFVGVVDGMPVRMDEDLFEETVTS